MARPAVSVVVPTFNREELLGEAIASVLGQSFADFELIVVDDESSDGTRDAVARVADPRLRWLPLRHSGNLSLLRNAGIRASRAPLVAFLDSDDLWREDKLAVQAGLLASDTRAGFVFSGCEMFTAAGVVKTKLYDGDGHHARTGPGDGAEEGDRCARHGGPATSLRPVFDDLIRGRMVIYSSSVLIRRQLLDRAGLLNEQLRTGDYELFTRLAWSSLAGIVHAPLIRVRRHPGNSSASWNAEGLEEAIFSVRRFYSLGAIGRQARDERLVKYHHDLANVLAARGNLAGALAARRECIRLRPAKLEHWRGYGSLLLRRVLSPSP